MNDQSNIVAANFAGNKPQPVPTPEAPPARLNVKDATEIGGALERWHALRSQAIKTPTTDAEIAGLTEFLANKLLTHAPELLGCWFIIRNEYEPAINSIVTLMTRAQAVLELRRPPAEKKCCAEGCCENKP